MIQDYIYPQMTKEALHEGVNPFQLKVARQLSQDLAVIQKNQLLTADILNKVSELSKLEASIVSEFPNTKERCDFIIKTFCIDVSKHIK